MTDIRQAAQQALEALEDERYVSTHIVDAITALKAALAQPEQEPEPVACRFCHNQRGCWTWQCYHCGEIDDVQKPTAAQPEQEPVGWEHHEYRPYGGPGQIRVHAVLASQYMLPDGSVSSSFQWLVDEYKKDKNTIKLIPLYTTPPAAQRPWVGLTKVQRDDFADAYGSYEAVCAIEQALKERNNG